MLEGFHHLTLQFKPLDARSYLKSLPEREDYDRLIEEPTLLYDADSGKLVAVYMNLPFDLYVETSALLPSLQSLPMRTLTRTSGLTTATAVFGYSPRNYARTTRYCHAARIDPKMNRAILKLGHALEAIYAQIAPDRYEEHAQAASTLEPHYRYTQVFTSGVINRDSAIAYHFDSGNLHGAWSAMIYLTKHVRAGETVFPEYRIAFAPRDGALVYFPGSILLHGVMPFDKVTHDAYRYTIVYYTLRGLWQCLPPPQEYEQYLRWRTEYEQRVSAGGRQYLADYVAKNKKSRRGKEREGA